MIKTMLSDQSIDKTYKDNQGNDILIFKQCLICCNGVRYYGYIEGDTSDNFYAYNSQGMRLDHKGRAISKGSLILE